YSEKYLKKSRWMFSLLSRVGKPKDFSRFITMANACLNHNCYDDLHKISCPTLVIGGADDKIVTANASAEIAKVIPDSQLYMYKGLGHATYEEAKDFNHRVIEFFDN
ncbi:MAG: alpha/beta hydrolase, partial [Acutalibacteraceae bacterium]|nr:alpha/beta hydrolase [Acutalibacteraceae bacterium]